MPKAMQQPDVLDDVSYYLYEFSCRDMGGANKSARDQWVSKSEKACRLIAHNLLS